MREPAALVADAAWGAAVIAVAVSAAAAVADSAVEAAVECVEAEEGVEAAVVEAEEDDGDKRTIDGEHNYEINIRKHDFVESIRDGSSLHDNRFGCVAFDRGAGKERKSG
jgi:hypothetical protein